VLLGCVQLARGAVQHAQHGENRVVAIADRYTEEKSYMRLADDQRMVPHARVMKSIGYGDRRFFVAQKGAQGERLRRLRCGQTDLGAG